MSIRIYQFQDYRTFFKARYEWLKNTKPAFSARYFARRAGIRSPSYFFMVVNGTRSLSRDMAIKFANGLDLDPKERDFLMLLVELDKGTSETRKYEILEELERIRQAQDAEFEMMSFDHLDILADPINMRLYTLVKSKKFKFNVNWLQKAMNNRLSNEELDKRIETLIKSGLWKIENGLVKAVAPYLASGDNLTHLALKKAHLELFEAGKKALISQKGTDRIVSGRSFLFDRAKMPEVIKAFNQFKQEIETQFTSPNSQEVFQLHMSFFELGPPETKEANDCLRDPLSGEPKNKGEINAQAH